jgi:hypothetical protein
MVSLYIGFLAAGISSTEVILPTFISTLAKSETEMDNAGKMNWNRIKLKEGTAMSRQMPGR